MNDTTGNTSPPPHPLDQQWYVGASGGTIGPISGLELKDLIAKGQVTPRTQICVVGAQAWTEAGSIPFLAGLFPEAAPAPPAPPVDIRIEQVGTGPLPVNNGPVRFAGFWIRAAAYLLDVVLLFVVSIVPVAVVMGMAHDPNSPLASLVGTIVAICYFVIPVSGAKQATWGKQMLGLKIIRTDGARVGGGLAFGRYLAYILSSLPLCIGFFMIGWTDQKKGLHDIICGTRVIYR